MPYYTENIDLQSFFYLRWIAQIGIDDEAVGRAARTTTGTTATRLAGRRDPDGGKRDQGTKRNILDVSFITINKSNSQWQRLNVKYLNILGLLPAVTTALETCRKTPANIARRRRRIG